MSYCELKVVNKSGDVIRHTEFRNAHGWSAYIWDKLFNKYAKNSDNIYDTWLGEENAKRLWALVDDERLDPFERRVLCSTFDNAMIKHEDLEKFIVDLTAFYDKHPPNNRVCHMRGMINVIREVIKDPEDLAICWYQMSVSDDLWWTNLPEEYCDKCGQMLERESRAYNINTDDKHWFLDFSKSSGLPDKPKEKKED